MFDSWSSPASCYLFWTNSVFCHRCWPISGVTASYSNRWKTKDGSTTPSETLNLLARRWISKPRPSLVHPTIATDEIRTRDDMTTNMTSGQGTVVAPGITGIMLMGNRWVKPTYLQNQIDNAAGGRAWTSSPLPTHQMITIPGGVGQGMTSLWTRYGARHVRQLRIQCETRMTTRMTGRLG